MLAAIIGQQLLPMARRRTAVPLMKLVLPVKDAKNGVTQSRMRYYLVRFSSPNGKQSTAYMELDSNGNKVRYTNRQGRTVVPPEPSEETVLDAGAFQFPAWGKVDWNDVLHGEDASGCWGMRSPSRP